MTKGKGKDWLPYLQYFEDQQQGMNLLWILSDDFVKV